MWNRTNFFRAKHENEVEAQRSKKLTIKQKCQSLFTWLCTKGNRRLGECEIVLIFFGQIMKMRSKRSEAKNCPSSKNVNLCLLDSAQSIAQGINLTLIKIGYINKTHTHIHKVELKTLYFNFDLPLQKRFLCSILRKRLAIEVSALDELMVLSIHAPLVS